MVEKDSKYKKSRFGMIPVSWDEKPIGKIAKTSSGGTPKRDNKEFYEGGTINWFKTGELVTKYVYTSEEKITEQALKESSAKLFPKETLLVAMYGATIGNMSILKEDSATNQACCAILPNEKYNTEYLYYQLSFLKNKLINRGAGGAQPNISQDIIQTFPVPLPNKNEQQKIASILSTWDKAIELKEKLIEQKKELKKGLMQKLLTGEVRLPGFKGGWTTKKLNDLCTKIMDGTHATPKYTETGIPFYSVENVTKRDFSNHKYISFEEHQNISSRCKVEKGDILMTRIGSIGDAVLVDWDYECSIYVSLALLKVNEKILPEYLVHYMATDEFRREILSKSLLSAIPQKINLVDIGRVKVYFPKDLNEQQAITNILDYADKEVSLLENELECLKKQKKGLMQLLLTGKVRVKV